MAGPPKGLLTMMALQLTDALACGCTGWLYSTGCVGCVSYGPALETLHDVLSHARVHGRKRPPTPGDRI